MVPGAADGVLDEDPLSERTVVVGALGADREQLVTAARQQHRFARTVSQDHAAFGDIRQRHSLGKIGSVELLLVFAHGRLLTYGDWQISQQHPILPFPAMTVEASRRNGGSSANGWATRSPLDMTVNSETSLAAAPFDSLWNT